MSEVLPLRDGQAEHAEPEEDRDAERQPRPERIGAGCDSGRPSSRPIRRPMSRPTTAVTNSAVESASTWRISHVAGTTVRYGRIAEADDDPGDDPQRDRATGRRRSRVNSPSPGRRQARARRDRRARRQGRGCSGSTTATLGVVPAVAAPRIRPRTGRQPSIARHSARHARDGAAPSAVCDRVRQVATATISSPSTRRGRRRTRRARARSPG